MKKIICLLLLALPIITFSQEIKEKKDQILFDGTPVAKVEKIGSDFKFTSLNNANSFTATQNFLKISNTETKQWLVIADSDGKRKSEILMEFLSFTLNTKKGIAELLAKKYKIITSNGVENLDAFFAAERPKFSDEVEKAKQANLANEKELATVNYQVLTKDKFIFSGFVPSDALTDKHTDLENKEYLSKVVAQYKIYKAQGSSPFPLLNIDISSLSDRVIAKAVESGQNMVVALNETNKTFVYSPAKRLNQSDPVSVSDFIIELMNQTYINGQKYMTLREAEALLSMKKDEQKAKFDLAKAN
jgi:hypothetical protein